MRAIAILLSCVLVTLIACDDAEPLSPVAEAAQRTADAGSFRYDLVSVTDPGTPEELVMLGDGVLHPEAERSWRRWAPEGGVFPDEDPELTCPDDRNEVVETPSTWYFLSLAFSACEPVWFELDMPALRARGVDMTAADVVGIGLVPTMEPMDALRYLRHVPGELSEVGAEQINGEDTTHYRLVVDLTEGGQELIDVWVDGSRHVRRVNFEGEMVSTLELSAVGSAPLPPTRPDGETQPGDWILELYGDADPEGA